MGEREIFRGTELFTWHFTVHLRRKEQQVLENVLKRFTGGDITQKLPVEKSGLRFFR